MAAGSTAATPIQQIQVLKTVAEWADRFTCIRKIHIFGSFVRGEAFSDIDIAVEYATKDPPLECYTAVNRSSPDPRANFEQNSSSSNRLDQHRGQALGYDQKAWEAIRSGRVIQSRGKAQLVWTEPKPKT